MQFLDFIFLARSWGADKISLGEHLTRIGHEAQANDNPLSLIIYPEGTLVSPNTRPLSKKYADKEGIVSSCLSISSKIWLTSVLLARRTCAIAYYLAPRVSSSPSAPFPHTSPTCTFSTSRWATLESLQRATANPTTPSAPSSSIASLHRNSTST